MRRLIALVLAAALMVGVTAPAAAGTASSVALGLASFAVFNQLFWPFFYPYPTYGVPVYGPPMLAPPLAYSYPPYQTVYMAQPPVPPPAPMPTVVQYPHGRYELRGDGMSTAYRWVWIPNPPPPPPPGPAQSPLQR